MREFGSEYYALRNEQSFNSLFRSFSKVELLSTGREALGLVAETVDLNGNCILLPAYSCSSMVEPFTKRGWTVFFYSLNEDLSVDESVILSLCKRHNPKAVLLMNYFGVAPTDTTAQSIKMHYEDIVIIEDFTHTLFSNSVLSNKYIDFFVASIRKWVGIFDGAIVLSCRSIDHGPLTENFEFVKMREDAQLLKFYYSLTKEEKLKERYLNLLKTAESEINKYDSIHTISKSSREVLDILDINQLLLSRKENFYHLFEGIRNINGIGFPTKFEDKIIDCPFSLPILVENQNEIQKQFASRGLYASVLWPINTTAREICSVSSRMSNSMLSIPIDQRYDYDDIVDIIKIIRTVIKIIN